MVIGTVHSSTTLQEYLLADNANLQAAISSYVPNRVTSIGLMSNPDEDMSQWCGSTQWRTQIVAVWHSATATEFAKLQQSAGCFFEAHKKISDMPPKGSQGSHLRCHQQ